MKSKLLELFAGSRSWGKIAEELGYEVFSVDWKDFKGIELAVISDKGDEIRFVDKVRNGVVNILSGADLGAITVIGPASIVKEIKRNPKKLELFLNK